MQSRAVLLAITAVKFMPRILYCEHAWDVPTYLHCMRVGGCPMSCFVCAGSENLGMRLWELQLVPRTEQSLIMCVCVCVCVFFLYVCMLCALGACLCTSGSPTDLIPQ